MQPQLVVIGFILLIILILVVIEIYGRIKLKKLVQDKWGKLPRSQKLDQEASLNDARNKAKAYRTYDSEIDDITWYDLDGIAVFDQINATYSSVGSEALYQRLRNFNLTNENQDRLESLIQYYQENPTSREEIQYQFAYLGKKDHNHVESYLNETKNQELGNTSFFVFLGILPILLLLTLFILPKAITVLLLIGSMLFNVIYYRAKKEALERELACMSYLVRSIATAKKIAKVATPFQSELKTNLKKIVSITKFGISFRIKSDSEAELFFDYISMMFMLPFISYHVVLDKIIHYEHEAKEVWRLLGELEVAAAVLNYRIYMPDTCQPIFTEEIAVDGTEVYHPLLATPVPNDVAWTKNTLVTGSNASGKSTYVKSIAISCMLASTINTALALTFSLPRGHILTSMAVEDDIFEGDSYFIAEIKSVKRILDLVEKGEPCLCFIDEILKGTNTIERIAASSGMISWLQPYQALAFVATHDIELTEILKEYCTNVHFEEQVTKEKGVTFDYLLRQGPSTSRNAIQLLQVLNYPHEVVNRAKAEAHYFDAHRTWQVINGKNQPD
ncbi:MutS-related protein [Isobaculum melis]|uniref:MutS domain V n=1 Tax=Isobaculum melis TaxID=142588 RepID=A0A1H9R516_9LACT|nr:DNA mismatch repair protein MutS [Isobaculum melis]SER67816.1 MutS domain V [Isobaculum melis]